MADTEGSPIDDVAERTAAEGLIEFRAASGARFDGELEDPKAG